jgi:putative flavoprotein involved in K+ transport
VLTAGDQRSESENVVVAMANYQVPKRPAFAAEIDASIVQLHAHEYRNPAQLPEGDVLIVGAGNSAADIAIEVGGPTKPGCLDKNQVSFLFPSTVFWAGSFCRA